MVDIDTKDAMSLKNATSGELIRAYKKLDWYFEFGPRRKRDDCLERLSNLLLEIRARKIGGDCLSAGDLYRHRLRDPEVVLE